MPRGSVPFGAIGRTGCSGPNQSDVSTPRIVFDGAVNRRVIAAAIGPIGLIVRPEPRLAMTDGTLTRVRVLPASLSRRERPFLVYRWRDFLDFAERRALRHPLRRIGQAGFVELRATDLALMLD